MACCRSQEPTTQLVNNNVIQFTAGNTPQPGDTLLANYRRSNAGTGTPQLFPSSQVLCSGTRGSVNTTSLGSLGSCTIPSGLLTSGDHVEIKFELAHQGTSGGFSFQVLWAGTTILQRTAAAGDAQCRVTQTRDWMRREHRSARYPGVRCCL